MSKERIRLGREDLKVDLSRQPRLDLRDRLGRKVRAVLVRVGEGNPFDGGRRLWFPDNGRVFFLLEGDRSPELLDIRRPLRGPQGIGADTFLRHDYVLQSPDGSFSLQGESQGQGALIEAAEAARLYAWLPGALGEVIVPPGARSRPSGLSLASA